MSFVHGHALVVAIANYPHFRRLPAPVLNDGIDVSEMLLNPRKCGYLKENVSLLLDGNATRGNIISEFKTIAKRTTIEDTVIIYFSGHGGRVNITGIEKNFLLPYDADPRDLENTTLVGEEITKLLRDINAGKLLVIFDSCHSGGTAEPKTFLAPFTDFKSGFSEDYYDTLRSGSGRAIIASSLSSEESMILPGMKNSLFTHYLLSGLNGGAASRGDGVIRVFDLFHYLSEKIPAHDSRQNPILKGETRNNFPICLHQSESGGSDFKNGVIKSNASTPKYQAGRDIVAPESNIGVININNPE